MGNPFGKTRPESEPYAVYGNSQGFIWKVLKTYKKLWQVKSGFFVF